MTATLRRGSSRVGRLTGSTGAWALAAGGTVLAAAYACTLGSAPRFGDEADYVTLAVNLAEHHRYSADGVLPTAYRPPGYPLLLGALAQVTTAALAFRLLGALLFGAAILLTYRLGRSLASDRVGLVAAGLVALNPLAVYTAVMIYPQMLAAALLVGGLVLVLDAARAPAPLGRAAAAGAVFGALALTVPTLALAAPLAGVWLAGRSRRPLVGAVLLATAVALVLPWTIRSSAALDAFVPLSTNSGFNLILGNSDGATGDSGTTADISRYVGEVERRGYGEVEQNAYYQGEALAWIREDPGRAGALYARKVAHALAVSEPLGTEGRSSPVQALLLAAWLVPVVALAVARLVPAAGGPLRPGAGLLALIYLACTLATAVFFTRIRFRVPLDPLLALLAADLVVHRWTRWRDARAAGAAAPV